MKQSETRDIILMLKAATNGYLDDTGVASWELFLSPLDAEVATQTLLEGVKQWTRFPSWAQFLELYELYRKAQRKLSEPDPFRPPVRPKEKFPEWVQVWGFARRIRKPRNYVPFPQQAGYVDDAIVMTMPEYEALREEWITEGRPTHALEELIPVRPKRDYAGEALAVLRAVADE